MHQTEAQNKQILEYLQKGNSLTPLEALKMNQACDAFAKHFTDGGK